MSSARSHTKGGWPRIDCGSNCRSFSNVDNESGCGNGVTMRRCLVSTRGTFRGVKPNSLPIVGGSLPRGGEGYEEKLQAPSLQHPEKLQIPRPANCPNVFGRAWCLGILWMLEVGAWSFLAV